MPYSKSTSVLTQEAMADLQLASGITNTAEDGLARKLVEGPLRYLSGLRADAEASERNRSLSTASSQGLDDLGAFFHAPRKLETAGITSASGVRFWLGAPRDTATNIAANTQVWAPGQPQRYFLTAASAVIPAGQLEVTTALVSPGLGTAYSASPFTLTASNAGTGISCVNLDAIAGSDREGDEPYRYRLSLARVARGGALEDSVRFGLLGLSGVLDLRITNARRGTGTFDVLVYTTEVVPTEDVVGYIERYLREGLAALGVDARVYGPTARRVDVTLRLGFPATVTSAQRTALRQQISTAVQAHINTRDLGEPLYLGRLRALAFAASPQVVDAEIIGFAVDGRARTPDDLTLREFERTIAGTIHVE